MKNIKLGIFVVGTTLMLWLGCSNYTWDAGIKPTTNNSLLETGNAQEDSLFSDNVGTMDELDE